MVGREEEGWRDGGKRDHKLLVFTNKMVHPRRWADVLCDVIGLLFCGLRDKIKSSESFIQQVIWM